MNTLKGQYEISIWEDVIKYVDADGNIYDSLEELAQAGATVNYQFYSEQRLAVIGSDTMTSLARAINPVLSRNINGVYGLIEKISSVPLNLTSKYESETNLNI